MKKYLLIMMVLLSFQTWGAEPKIKFLESIHEFGNVKENNGPVSYNFKFVNDGDAPLVIVSAIASCGCTTPTYPEAPIAPGDTAAISVKFNPKGRPGEFNKTIVVKSNSVTDSRARLKIKGCVIPSVKK